MYAAFFDHHADTWFGTRGGANRSPIRDLNRAEARLERTSAAFVDRLNARFDEWGLTTAERDVALFAIKGMSVQEMSRLRATSEGTIKAQTAAICRKANVSGRPQLLSLFIEDMMGADRSNTADIALAAGTCVAARGGQSAV